MARTELPNGVILPAEYSDDWYEDMSTNLNKLDEVIGSDAGKLSEADVSAVALSGDYDDLTNKPDLKPVATSGDYDDLTDLPTYGITRYCSSAITDNSSIAFSNISSTNKIKVGDFLLDTAGKMYQISAVDTANETVSVTTPLTQLAVDANVMHLSGNETADGLKTFLKYITSDGSSTGDEYSSNTRTNLWLMSNRDTEEVSGILFDSYRQNTAQGTGIHILGIGIKENSVRYEGCRFCWYWDNNLNGYYFDFKPTTQGANQARKHNLGTSTDKWDTINGLNPGCLSLPDLNNGIDISGYLTNAGTTTPSEYTPTVNGWLVLKVGAPSGVVSMHAYSNSGVDNYTYSERSDICDTTGSSYARFTSMTIPCVANDKVKIIIMPSTASVVSAIFYPCLGNV